MCLNEVTQVGALIISQFLTSLQRASHPHTLISLSLFSGTFLSFFLSFHHSRSVSLTPLPPSSSSPRPLSPLTPSILFFLHSFSSFISLTSLFFPLPLLVHSSPLCVPPLPLILTTPSPSFSSSSSSSSYHLTAKLIKLAINTLSPSLPASPHSQVNSQYSSFLNLEKSE